MGKSTILVVEDDEITRSLLFDVLVHEGYDVAVAENGRKAIDYLRGTTPDLIISDVVMPEVNGLELFRKVQEEDQLQSLPFIFLTSVDDTEELLRLKELGPDEYLAKPVRPRHLLATVKGKLRRKQLREKKAAKDTFELRERIRWTLSHELRTPLTIIQGISELLLNEGQPATAADYNDLLQSLRSQSLQLGSLIENFLLVSRIDSGIEHESWRAGAGPVLVKEAVEEAAFPFLERARTRGASFVVEAAPDLPPVHAYRPHLLEILRQVLDNAFKFADARQPRIALRACEQEGCVKISLADNGGGIGPEQRALLFQKLSQVDREVHEQQGSGLGLYITKKLVDLNGGSIELRSEPGRGAEILIALPTRPPEEA